MKPSYGEFSSQGKDFKEGFTTISAGQDQSLSLKGKLLSLEQLIKTVQSEINFNMKEVQVLRGEKDTLDKVLTMKIQDVKQQIGNELFRVDEEIKRNFSHQKAENTRLQQQITSLKYEETSLQQQLLGLSRRVQEIELQVGHEDN